MVEQTTSQLSELPNISGKNSNFWSQFGHFDDPDSFLHSAKLLAVRHAESEENAYWSNRSQDTITDVDMIPKDTIENTLLDCKITAEG